MAKRWTWSPKIREKLRATVTRRIVRFDATIADEFRRMRAEGATYLEIAATHKAAEQPRVLSPSCGSPGETGSRVGRSVSGSG